MHAACAACDDRTRCMADMRRTPLSDFGHRRILRSRCCAGRMSSQSRRCRSMFPSGRCCRPPRRYTDQPGPDLGPGFFMCSIFRRHCLCRAPQRMAIEPRHARSGRFLVASPQRLPPCSRKCQKAARDCGATNTLFEPESVLLRHTHGRRFAAKNQAVTVVQNSHSQQFFTGATMPARRFRPIWV